ncbi:acyltransferase family protein [Pseudarthrobacter sp. P1]|uniref:acyltransferase family protein n=1 Tax=Pseudarthrobacter sp. P1 TaxID=3418418 RepID=UPI003CEF1A74
MTTTLPSTGRARKQKHHAFRPEIQALRALAVALVVVYHLAPQKLTGGFVGVDVFFVISGYLISDHLVRGMSATPRLRLRDFYVRRAKRLLPASLLVLLFVAILTLAVVPQTSWGSVGVQLVSSAFYVQNWTLAANSVDYLAADSGASPVQHFWSLSVEEQFYAVWPLLILGVITIAKHYGWSARKVLITSIATVTAASFAYSVWATWSSAADAYFITPTRVWEFGVGALLALALQRTSGGPAWIRSALSWAGLAGIALAAVTYAGATPFPGYTALLPVLATAAVIWGGAPGTIWGPSAIFKFRPVQFLGDISYSVYLWHWPLIVLGPIIVGGKGSGLSMTLAAGIVLVSVALAWLTKIFVEDRFRVEKGNRCKARRYNGRILVGIAAAMVSVGILGGVTMFISQNRSEAANIQLDEFSSNPPQCFGADVLASGEDCASGGILYPDPVIASTDVAGAGCQQRATRAEAMTCTFGSQSPDAYKVALVGDSHAGQWLGALEGLAEKRGWSVTTYLKSSCAFTEATSFQRSCAPWNAEVSRTILSGDYDLIVTSSVSTAKYQADSGETTYQSAVDGLRERWSSSTIPIVALADTPRPSFGGVSDPPSCVDTKSDADCSFPQSKALKDEPQKEAAEGLNQVHFLDMTKYFCRSGDCQSVLGNVLVYRDSNHMTATFSKSLANYLELEMQSAGVKLSCR